MLAWIISRPISLYSGITIGRATPDFSPIQWLPSVRFTKTNPSRSKTHRNRRHEIGVILAILPNPVSRPPADRPFEDCP
jgi:hypothetical protein